ncbi:MAG: phosphatase PAP2 family protein [Clostridium sp.]|nr:phosphatase PAP2 family protein [Clostridium sp.]
MIQSLADIFGQEAAGEQRRGLLAIEKLCIGYALFTAVLTLVLWTRLDHPVQMLLDRFQILLATGALWAVYRAWPCRLLRFARITVQMGLLNYWYPETYEFNRVFDNLDWKFASWEQELFGGQPSVWFSQALPGVIFSEAFNLGYFSYYPMILVVMLFYFLCRYPRYEEASFIVMCSFFIYYLIYIFVPVAGPQFYFQAIGMDNVAAGNFPSLGTYFADHTEMLPAPGYADGFFYKLVAGAQNMGERPTAAFPSSHIGVTMVLMILAFRTSRRLALCLLPFCLLLCCATVYIQAHYLIDAIAGCLSSVAVYYLSRSLYHRWFVRR